MVLNSFARQGQNTRLQSREPLTNEQIYRIAPSIFAPAKHDSRSERYTYIPTIEVLDGLRAEGFQPFFVAQGRSRIPGKSDYTKHLLRLRQMSSIETLAAANGVGHSQIVGAEFSEIVLVNSHDGTSSYRMMAGVFRVVCTNGLISGDIVDEIKVPHRGNIIQDVVAGAFNMTRQFGNVCESVGEMKELQLRGGAREAFAAAALSYKYGEEAPIHPVEILMPRRREDDSKDLWTTFNVVQEHLMKGGQHYRNEDSGRHLQTRPVQAIDGDVKLNRALWILAEKMKELAS